MGRPKFGAWLGRQQMQIERLALDVKYLGKDRAIVRFYPKAEAQ